jgi:hypothetical protein
MRTDGGVEPIRERPGLEDAANLRQERLQVGCLLQQQLPNVGAWRRARASEADDVFDFSERQPEPSTLLDEAEHGKGLVGIVPIARSGAARRRQDGSCLI